MTEHFRLERNALKWNIYLLALAEYDDPYVAKNVAAETVDNLPDNRVRAWLRQPERLKFTNGKLVHPSDYKMR